MDYTFQELDQKFLKSNFLLYCVVLLLVVKIAVIGVSVNFPKNIFFADITKSALTNFINQGRADSGLRPLAENQTLDKAAELKAQDMIQKGYFSHQSPEGTTPWFWFKTAGYNYKYAGENLAIGFIDSKEVYNAWYNSASHRENILNPNYKEIGTAILSGFGENKAVIVVQLFGSVESAKAPANPAKTTEQIEQNVAENAQPENSQLILSQSTQAMYNYEWILQNIIYGFMVVIGSTLLLNIFINFSVQRKGLILRVVIIMALLFSAAVINKDIIVQIIPHTITI